LGESETMGSECLFVYFFLRVHVFDGKSTWLNQQA